MNKKKIIVIQPLPGIGDTIWFLPHLHALGTRGDLTLLTKKTSQAAIILKHDLFVKDIQYIFRNPGPHDGIPGFFKMVSQLRQGNFEEAWILHKSPRYAYMTKAAGIPHIYSFGTGLSHLFNEKKLKFLPSQLVLHPIECATLLLKSHGYAFEATLEYRLYNDASALSHLQQKVSVYPKPYFVLGIGGSAHYKKWPLARWAALAKAIFQEKGGHIFLLGGPGEDAEAQTILSLLDDSIKAHVTAFTQLPLNESMALAGMAHTFIGNDTGMLNIAAAAGTPSWGLFHEQMILNYTSNLKAVLPGHSIPHPFKLEDIMVDDVMKALTHDRDT